MFPTDSTNCWNIDGEVEQSAEKLTLIAANSRATTTTAYEDFILELECKTTEGALGGIYFHSQGFQSLKYGYEVLINNNREANDWRKTGSLAAVRNFGKCLVGNEEWFPIRIEVRGMNIRVYVGDYHVVDYHQPKTPYRLPEYNKRRLSEGVFVFVNRSDYPISFRNLQIKVLEKGPGNTTQALDEQNDELIRYHQMNFPLIDTHLHLCDSLTVENVEDMSRKYGITYGIAPGCGLESGLLNNEQAEDWLKKTENRIFFTPLQIESVSWKELFSSATIQQFDYIVSDALAGLSLRSIQLPRGKRYLTEEEQMDELVAYMSHVIQTESADIYANPTLLPEEMRSRAKTLWTTERMERLIDACVSSNTAIEINTYFQLPSQDFIRLAKDKGAKFALGTNNHTLTDIDQLAYALSVIRSCGLTAEDMYIPITTEK
ncbi:DUF1080 domain-containing protein [Bacteroidales bacterium OttesenSCG-928-J19]|nr:DUF1080 domain-containing protein [Bacteroidales bacterium OttesenSCG-928-J19]